MRTAGAGLADSLVRIEGQGAADFLANQLRELNEPEQKHILEHGFWNGLKTLRPNQLPSVLRGIAASAIDLKLQELAMHRLSELNE